MSIQDKLKDLKDLKSYSIPAKRVMEQLKPILSKSNELRIRWMWELLQNATDLGDNIKTRFELTNDQMVFSHNGKSFTLDEAYNLIMPDSTKDDDVSHKKSVIGQFGTGFISTHILSKVIKVSGIIQDDEEHYSFDFKLDRTEREDKDFLIDSIKKSEFEYRNSLILIDELPDDEFSSSFTYFIDQTFSLLAGQDIVDDGIKSFVPLIPFVFAFRPQLSEIEIIDGRISPTRWSFQKEEVENDIDNLIIIKTVCYKNGVYLKNKLVGKIIDGETEIAFPIEEIQNNQFKLLSFPKDCPKLFCAFPMIGTSDFNFPVLVHSEKFVPNRERDGIEIGVFDAKNRDRLIEAKDAFKKLLKIIEDHEWTDAYNVCKFSNPDMNDADTRIWFTREIFTHIKDSIYDTKLIELDGSIELEKYRSSLRSIFVPYADRRAVDKDEIVDRIYNFAFAIIPDQIPCKKHYKYWYDTIDFEIFSNEKLDIEKLCELVSRNAVTLSEFAKDVSLTEDEIINFFIDLVEFVLAQENKELLNKYNLLLNQSNIFTKLKGIKIDNVTHKGLFDGYDEKLKDIYYSLSDSDCRDSLLNQSFEKIENLIDEEDKLEFRELAKDTDEKLRNYEGNFQDENFLLILKELFHWYTTCGLSNETLINLFPFFSSNKSQLYLNTKTPQELEYAFDIEISGKSEVLAKLAKSSLSETELEIIADNPELVSSFIAWLNSKQQDNPDKELGDIGEEFLYHQLCQIFGEDRVLWEDISEYDFRVLEKDLTETKYYIDAKTTASGIANSDNVPFFMRSAQWRFLDNQIAYDKYIIARVFMNAGSINVKYLKLNRQHLKVEAV